MWWPRPRWKSEFFTHFILLLFVSTCTTTTSTVMADEGQLCSGSNMSAVVWTTAFCTVLLVLVIVAIYFVYCKRKEHDWSSLWWKNSSDKNLVLQTLPPAKEQLQKNGGTDNPAFSADTNAGDHVTRTGLTRIVSVPLSTIEDGSLGIELSKKNEEDGRQIYTYKQKDGSQDRLVAMRLVFDNGQRQLQCGGPPSDLNRALVELSRKYGLTFELETEKETAAASLAVDENGNGTEKCAKSNLLSTVRGKAQRLWNQRQAVFKTGDGDSGRSDKETVDHDLEGGRAVAIAPTQKTSCSVTTVNENKTDTQQIAPVRNGSLKRYHTLDYGASAQSSPDSGVHCCTVNPSAEPVPAVQMEVTATRAAETTAVSAVAADDNCDRDHADATVCDGKNTPAEPNADDEPTGAGTRHATASNPPPPPPRKYSSQVIQAAAVVQQVTAPTTVAAPAVVPDAALPVIGYSAPPDKAAVPAKHEIRMDDDYYWCTTTSMAPPMSTFGKRPSVADGAADGTGDSGGRTTVDQTGRNEIVGGLDDGVAGTVALDDMDGGGIEDASLPPFSSDDDDEDDNDDDGVFAGKTKFDCAGVQTTADEASPSGDNGGGKDKATPAKASPRNGVFAAESAAESKSPTKLPTLKLSLSSPLSSTASYCSSSSASSTASTSSSPTNNGSNNNSPIVSKIPVRRQSSSNCIGTVPVAVSTPLTNGTAKKSIPLPLSRSGSRLAMWSSAN